MSILNNKISYTKNCRIVTHDHSFDLYNSIVIIIDVIFFCLEATKSINICQFNCKLAFLAEETLILRLNLQYKKLFY